MAIRLVRMAVDNSDRKKCTKFKDTMAKEDFWYGRAADMEG